METLSRSKIISLLFPQDAGSAERVVAVVKPKLRGLLHRQIKMHLAIGVCLSLASGAALKVFVADVRKQRYAEYHRTHDWTKDFQSMKEAGVFQSC